MTIIFAPAKLFNDAAKTTSKTTMFDDITQSIVSEIKAETIEILQSRYKVSDKMIDTIYNYYQNFDQQQRYVAFDYFLGESFKAFNFQTLNQSDIEYLNDNVYIIDALYGLIKPLDGINPYRMDFTHKGYKDIWKAPINNHLSQDKSKTILSLASKEFNALIDTSKFNLYEVSFIDCKDDVCKKISVFNKQMRGTLLRYIVDQNLSDVDSLPRKINGYIKNVSGMEINYIKQN